MSKDKIFAVFFALFASLCLTKASVIVEATGFGVDVEQAKKDTINNAIRFSMGEYVRSKETLNNEELNQKVLSFSNAYVLGFEQIALNQTESNLFEMKAKVEIEDSKLIGVMKDLNIDIKDINQGVFKVYVDERYKKKDNFKEMFEEVVLAPLFSGEAYKAELTSFEPYELSSKKDRFRGNSDRRLLDSYLISFTINYQKGYLEGVEKFFDKVATKTQGKECDKRNLVEIYNNSGDREPNFCYILPQSLQNPFITTKENILNNSQLVATIELLDDTGEAFKFFVLFSDSSSTPNLSYSIIKEELKLVDNTYSKDKSIIDYNLFFKFFRQLSYFEHSYFHTIPEMTLAIDLNQEEIQKLKSMKINVAYKKVGGLGASYGLTEQIKRKFTEAGFSIKRQN